MHFDLSFVSSVVLAYSISVMERRDRIAISLSCYV